MKRKQQAAAIKAEQAAADEQIWQQVARTVRPLRRKQKHSIKMRKPPKTAVAAENAPEQAALPAAAAASARLAPPAQNKPAVKAQQAEQKPPRPRDIAAKKTSLSDFDNSIYRRLARGALPIEARLDLHGLTQAQAYEALLYFIGAAQARGQQYVLIITGRGRSLGSEGVLQRQVPQWLAQAPFRLSIAAAEPAARGHGGIGAFYVRLRRADRLKSR